MKKLIKLVDQLELTNSKAVTAWQDLANLTADGLKSAKGLNRLVVKMKSALKHNRVKEFKITWDQYQIATAKHSKLYKLAKQ